MKAHVGLMRRVSGKHDLSAQSYKVMECALCSRPQRCIAQTNSVTCERCTSKVVRTPLFKPKPELKSGSLARMIGYRVYEYECRKCKHRIEKRVLGYRKWQRCPCCKSFATSEFHKNERR